LSARRASRLTRFADRRRADLDVELGDAPPPFRHGYAHLFDAEPHADPRESSWTPEYGALISRR
jgi:hypothetical protein